MAFFEGKKMAVTIQHFSRTSMRLNKEAKGAGSLEFPASLSIDGELHNQNFQIANNANTVLYSDELGTFDVCHISSDFDVRLLITSTDSNSFNITLKGSGRSGEYGFPFVLGDDLTVSSATINAFQAFNTSGSTANVQVFIAD